MTDREKIIEILKKNGTYNGRSLSFDYYVIQPDDLADALIANGYGDVSEWKKRAEVAERALMSVCTNVIKDEKDDVAVEPRARVLYKVYLGQAEKRLAELKGGRE